PYTRLNSIPPLKLPKSQHTPHRTPQCTNPHLTTSPARAHTYNPPSSTTSSVIQHDDGTANACQIVELWECECFLAIFGVPFRIGGMAAVLEFDQITKKYRSFSGRRSLHAVDSVTVEVRAGAMFGLLDAEVADRS